MGSNGVAPSKIRRALDDHAAQQESALARVIGETVASRLADMFGQVLPGMPWNPGCLFCTYLAKAAVAQHAAALQAWQVAQQNAQQAAEPFDVPPPELAEPSIAQSITEVPVTQLADGPAGPVPVTVTVPACWAHVQLPQAPPRQTGLVMPDGRPIVATAGQ